MARLLTDLGHPEQAYRAVHVAGSNGKGSTTAFLSTMLSSVGASRRHVHVTAFGLDDRARSNFFATATIRSRSISAPIVERRADRSKPWHPSFTGLFVLSK